MTIFEKIDMARHRRDVNLCKPLSQPDATGFSGVAPDEIETKPSVCFSDYSEEHGIAAKTVPIAKANLRIASQMPAISKDKEV